MDRAGREPKQRSVNRTWEVGLGAAGFVAGAAEGPGGAGVTVLRLRAATSQTSHLAVRPVNHLDELSHPEDRGGGRREESRKKHRAKTGWKDRRSTSGSVWREVLNVENKRCPAGSEALALVLLEHEEKVWVPLQEVGVQLLGGLDGLAHSTRQHQLLDLCRPTGSVVTSR